MKFLVVPPVILVPLHAADMLSATGRASGLRAELRAEVERQRERSGRRDMVEKQGGVAIFGEHVAGGFLSELFPWQLHMNGHCELNGMHPGALPFSPNSPEYSQFSANNMGSNQTPWPNNLPNQFIPQYHHQQQLQQPPINAGFMNHMHQFSSTMGINPLIQQQILQDALAMFQPVEAADEPLLVQVLLSAKKKHESYKDALNGLHGVSPVFCTTAYVLNVFSEKRPLLQSVERLLSGSQGPHRYVDQHVHPERKVSATRKGSWICRGKIIPPTTTNQT